MLWKAQARPLPVTVRPMGDETVISYSRRLSEANGLGPTTILRALGSTSIGTGRHLLTRDAWLNDHALDRLETYSGIGRARLARALPALRSGWPNPKTRPRELDIPFLQIHRTQPAPRAACHRCNRHRAQHPNPVPALIRPTATRLICLTHRRWLGSGTAYLRGDDVQHDLSAAPEVITAHRRYRRLIDNSDDPHWTHRTFLSTWFMVTSNWANLPRRPNPNPLMHPYLNLEPRWRARAERLALPTAPRRIPALVTFPEAVALAELFTDLGWRRHVAMVDPLLLDHFHRLVAARFDCAPPLTTFNSQPQITSWIETLRSKHRAAREELIRKAHHLPVGTLIPFPETCHFK
jgi:hypothetical protein